MTCEQHSDLMTFKTVAKASHVTPFLLPQCLDDRVEGSHGGSIVQSVVLTGLVLPPPL